MAIFKKKAADQTKFNSNEQLEGNHNSGPLPNSDPAATPDGFGTILGVHFIPPPPEAKRSWRRLFMVGLFAVFSVLVVSFVLTWQFDSNQLANQQEGEVALSELMAPKSHSYVSAVKTKEIGDAAAAKLSNRVFKRDEALISRERQALMSLLNRLALVRSESQTLIDRSNLRDDPAFKASDLDDQQLATLLNLPESTWTQINQEARTVFNILMNRDILPGERAGSLTLLRDSIYVPYTLSATFAQLDEASRELTVGLVKPFIKSNNVLDEAATRKRQEEARTEVGPATIDIVKGTALVRRGDILTPVHIEQLKELGLRNTTSPNLSLIIGTVGITSLLVLLLIFYCSMLDTQVWAHPRWLIFLGICMATAALAMRILVVDAGKNSSMPYLLPLAAIAIVVAALFDPHLALFFSALLALLVGLMSGTPELVAVFFVGSAAGALTIRKAEHTSVFAYAGIAVALSQFAVGFFALLLNRSLENSNITLLFFFSLLNGLISASLAFFCFGVLGKLFGVATVLQLLELAHPNQPLLRRLIREAPGTYHHSVMVSNLAEQAAERVADNALLARVGAYYHDIGKLSRPSFYIDNQAGGVNVHDSLDPRESAHFIKQHVLDGVVLARKHNLPRKVVDIIHQHHGTCMISFFYQKALKMGLDVSELDFRYPGPKPQTKVAAIVMLADGCEAAVRANVQSGRILTGMATAVPAAQSPDSPGGTKLLTIRDVVNKIIDDRIRDNQLSECDLTLRDVETIRELFVEILNGIYHPRIVYPDKEPAAVKEVEPIVMATSVDPSQQSLASLASLVVVAEPVGVAVPASDTLGAADSGGDTALSISSFPSSQAGPAEAPLHSSLLVAEQITERLNRPGKRGIGGAGRQIEKP